ncbi:DUF4347 domain-containing protein, partial [Microcoleus sp. BR0-C5]
MSTTVENYQMLVAGVMPGIQTVVLDPQRDGVEQITELLSNSSGVEAIHIISHGTPGSLDLGGTQLSLDTLDRYASQLQQWDVPSLLLYGCNVAVGDAGEEFVEKLHQLTGSGVAASRREIGDGYWSLEFSSTATTIPAPFHETVLTTWTGRLAPTISNLNDSFYNEQDPAYILDNDITFEGNTNYGGGSLLFSLSSPTPGDFLTLVDAGTPVTTFAEISVVGNTVYLGNGTTAFIVGFVDPVQNGQNGQNLLIQFTSEFQNSDFTTGITGSNIIAGWTTVNNQVRFGIDTIAGLPTPIDTTIPALAPNSDQNIPTTPGTLTSTLSDVTSDGTGNSVQLTSANIWTAQGYDVVRGPSIYSNDAVTLSAGDTVSFDWRALGGGDAYDVYGYLVEVTTGNILTILDRTGDSETGFTNWATETVTVPQAGAYKFVFVSGTYDFTGLRAAGGQLYVDNVEVTQANAPLNLIDMDITALARLVQYSNTSDNPVSQTLTVTAEDNNRATGSATATITINYVNDAPSFTATNPPAVNEDAGAQIVPGWATFNPGGGTDEATQTATYTVTNINNLSLFATLPAVDPTTGNLTYTPAPGASGTSTFDVVVRDSGGNANGSVDTFTLQNFTIAINGVNDAPSFSNGGNQTLVAATNAVQTVPSWANTFNFGPNEATQAVANFLVTTISGNSLFTALPAVANDGTLTYTPNGTPGTAIFDVQLQDNGGTEDNGVDISTPSRFTITIPAPTVNLEVSPTTGSEAGTTSITVTATTALPVVGDQTVDLDLTGVDAADFTGPIPTQITIADGQSSGQVTFTIADDNIAEIDEIANLSISNASAGLQLGTTTTGSFTILDNGTAGFEILPISGDTSESGDQATFDIRLTSQPSADVIIGLASNNTAEGTVLPANLTFNSTNWNVYQTATIIGVEDAVADGDIPYQIITTATSTDTNYNTLDPAEVNVTNTDNDSPGVTLTQSAGSTEVTEGGITNSYTLQLNTLPIGNVQITVTADAQAEVSLDGTNFAATQTLTFTNVDGQTPQAVIVRAVDDTLAENNHIGALTHAITNSTDPNYPTTLAIGPVNPQITDNDITYSVVGSTATVTEGNSGTQVVSFTVTRTGETNQSSSIDFSFGGTATTGVDYDNAIVTGTGVTATGSTVSFAANATIATIAVAVVGDRITEPDETLELTLSNATAPGTAKIIGSPITTTIQDDDIAGISITPTSGLTTTEAGGTATFTVVLDTQPTADVTIGTTSDNTAEGTVDKPSLTFTSANWNTPQTVTVTGIDDLVVDGNVAYNIVTAAATSTDTNYSGVNATDVAVTNSDNDSKGITVTPTSGLTTTEAGGTATFTVVLDTQP